MQDNFIPWDGAAYLTGYRPHPVSNKILNNQFVETHRDASLHNIEFLLVYENFKKNIEIVRLYTPYYPGVIWNGNRRACAAHPDSQTG